MKPFKIRFDEQTAFEKNIDIRKPIQYVESLGMNVISCEYSSFGCCFFLQVSNYIEDKNKICNLIKT